MSDSTIQLASELDASVNFVTKSEDFPGSIEARYVRRNPEYFIVYLSSQTGCQKACRFCHLTQTGQTAYVNVGLEAYRAQAEQVLDHYDALVASGGEAARSVHFNFMSRGEALANPTVLESGPELCRMLSGLATDRGLIPRLKFSTIMPAEMAEFELAEVFAGHNPDVYYSLYSVDPIWRRRWMPKALAVEASLAKLVDYQQLTRKVPVLHWALIAGENDSEADITAIADTVNQSGLRCDFNFVRYNPYSPAQGTEPEFEVIERNAQLLEAAVPGARVKIVGRVGFDVKASCGMFVGQRRQRRAERSPVLQLG